MKRVRMLVSGRVQGVFYRESTRRAARHHGVSGWVRNLSDGRVEAVLEGSEDDVQRVVEWARSGPRWADVDHLEVSEEDPEGLNGFEVR